jgi:predicted RNA-binding protein YlxR (DUF448 family)
MKVSLAKHGGMAAAINLRLPPRVVDSDALPKAAAEELIRLAAAAKAAPAATEEKPGRGADVMAYTITIEEGGTRTVLKQSDTAMSPAFDALRSWLEKHSVTTR